MRITFGQLMGWVLVVVLVGIGIYTIAYGHAPFMGKSESSHAADAVEHSGEKVAEALRKAGWKVERAAETAATKVEETTDAAAERLRKAGYVVEKPKTVVMPVPVTPTINPVDRGRTFTVSAEYTAEDLARKVAAGGAAFPGGTFPEDER